MGIRWRICALLFFATTINYMDRQIFGILGPTLQEEIGWSESQYGIIVACFTFAYAFGYLFAGRFLDWIGVKKGFGLSVGGWSLAAMGHALASTPVGFGIARVFLGITEGGNFPGAVKATCEWFPKRERSFATGIFNSGSNVGVVAAAILAPFLTLHYGWRMAFIVQGGIGLIWLLFWVKYRSPEEHPNLSKEELDLIQSDRTAEHKTLIPFRILLGQKKAWACAIGKMMTDPVWWFYLYWLPKYLLKEHGITLGTLALPLIIIYAVADLGSIAGGWLSTYFVKRGKTPAQARRLAMLVCALCVLPTSLLPLVTSVWQAVALVSLAAAAHQGWSANVYNLPSDMYPSSSVGSLVGFGGFVGSMASMVFQVITGYYLQWSGNNYAPVFILCGIAYIVAWFVVRIFVGSVTENKSPTLTAATPA